MALFVWKKERKTRMRNLKLMDGKRMVAPEEVDITKVGYFDEMEYELWDTIKKYLVLFGIKLEEPDEKPDWYTVKSVQDKIVQVLQEAGVNFKTEATSKEVINTEFPVVLLDTDIESILQVALCGGIARWCTRAECKNKENENEFYRKVTDGGTLFLYDYKSDKTLGITKEYFLSGFQQYLKKPTGADILELIDHELRVNLNAVDSKVADAIIQYALFGKIQY